MKPVRIFFIFAFGLTWGIGGIGLLLRLWAPGWQPFSTSSPLYYLAAYSVSLAGIVFTTKYEGREGLRSLGQRLTPWRSGPHWYLIVVLGYALMTGIALRATAFLYSTLFSLPTFSFFFNALLLAIVKDPGPIGEEFGWRGFALPKLLERYSPVNATLRLGILHTAWHLPLFFIAGIPQTQVSFPLFTLGVISIAVFDTAIYLRTEANLLLAILLHLMANVCGGIALGAHAFGTFMLAQAIAAAMIVTAGGLKSARPTDRTNTQTAPA